MTLYILTSINPTTVIQEEKHGPLPLAESIYIYIHSTGITKVSAFCLEIQNNR